jgi:thioredoxin 1
MVQEIKTWKKLRKLANKLPEDQLLVVDCYASWCGPCKKIAPFVDELAESYTEAIFVKADVEEIDELTSEFKVSAMPTFIFIKNATVIDKLQGASQSKLVNIIESNL